MKLLKFSNNRLIKLEYLNKQERMIILSFVDKIMKEMQQNKKDKKYYIGKVIRN